MVAASAGFNKACALLLENGANVYAVDQNGNIKFEFKRRNLIG